MKKICFAVLLLCVVSASTARALSDQNTVVTKGEIERFVTWTGPGDVMLRGVVYLRHRVGSLLYVVPYTCVVPEDCTGLDFLCSEVTTDISDPGVPEVTVLSTHCATLAAENCFLIDGYVTGDVHDNAEIFTRGGPVKLAYSKCVH